MEKQTLDNTQVNDKKSTYEDKHKFEIGFDGNSYGSPQAYLCPLYKLNLAALGEMWLGSLWEDY